MANASKLNKALWTNITRLRLLIKPEDPVRFILEENPFDDEEEEKAATERDEYVVIGKVLPKTGIYQENGFRIEIKLTSRYPQEPPEVRLLTPVYHPNFEENGKFCHQLLNNASRWKSGTTLVEVVKIVAKYLNEPDPDYAVDFKIAKEYMEKKEEFMQKASDMAKKSCPPLV